jgi:hypothetical protein
MNCLISVVGRLEWSFNWDAEVSGLFACELGEHDVELLQMGRGDFFVEDLWEHGEGWVGVARLGWLAIVPQDDLGHDLVGEGARHNERWVTSGAAEVHKTAFSEKDDVSAGRHLVSVDLRLDVLHRLGVGFKPSRVDFAIEVTDVADNGVVLHGGHVITVDDAGATSGGDEDHALWGGDLHGGDLVTLHGGLKSVDRVNFSDDDTGTEGTECLGATFTDITVTGDNGDFTCDHHIGGTLDAIEERFSAAVQVIELGLGDRVVDVDGWELELTLLEHLVQVVDTSGGFLGHTADAGEEFWVLGVDNVGQVTTIIEDHVEWLAVWEDDGGFNAPPEFFVGETFPGC